MRHPEVRFCPSHPGRRLEGFCRTCGSPFCRACGGHGAHDVETLDEFCERNEETLPPVSTLPQLLPLVEEATGGVSRAHSRLEAANADLEHRLAMGVEIKEKGEEEALRSEICLVEAAHKFLIRLEEKACTAALKEACKEARILFDLEDKIRDEVCSVDDNMMMFREKMRKTEEELKILSQDLSRLKCIKEAIEREDYDNDYMLSMLLLDWKGVLKISSMGAYNYESFPGVRDIFDFDSVMEKELVYVGSKMSISKPVEVKMGLRSEGHNFYASVSNEGVLAIFSNNKENTMQFTNLKSSKQVNIAVERTSHAAFYDDKVILLTLRTRLRQALVSSLFREPKMSTFTRIEGTSKVYCDTDVTLLNKTRTLYYPAVGGYLCSFNVDTKTEKRVSIPKNVWCIASFMGLSSDVNVLFQDYGRNILTISGDSDTISILKVPKATGWLRNIFVPINNVKNINKAVFRYEKNISGNGEGRKIDNPVQFEPNYSIIRMYKDVFLLYDTNLKSWALSRIVVQ